DADARGRELRESPREPRRRRHGAPDREPDGDDGPARAAIREPRDRDAGRGVEERERDPREEAHRGVADPEILLDRLEQNREDLPVDEVEDVDDEEEPE